MGNSKSRLKFKFKKSTPEQLPLDGSLDEGRRELTYYLSNNVSDVDRLNMFTFFKKHLFQNYFTSPVEDKLIQGGCKVLDVACGPGTWLLCMSNEYENSDFIGLDIKPLFPREIKPKNLEFIEADIFNGLPFPDNEFDFVHMDSMNFIFTREQWDFTFSELIRVAKSSGYIEVTEAHIKYINAGPILYKLYEGIHTSSLKRNVDIRIAYNLDSVLESHSNITKVNRDERTVILGPNGGKFGMIGMDMLISHCTTEMATIDLSTELGMSKEEYKDMVEKDLMEELKKTKPDGLIVRFWTQKN